MIYKSGLFDKSVSPSVWCTGGGGCWCPTYIFCHGNSMKFLSTRFTSLFYIVAFPLSIPVVLSILSCLLIGILCLLSPDLDKAALVFGICIFSAQFQRFSRAFFHLRLAHALPEQSWSLEKGLVFLSHLWFLVAYLIQNAFKALFCWPLLPVVGWEASSFLLGKWVLFFWRWWIVSTVIAFILLLFWAKNETAGFWKDPSFAGTWFVQMGWIIYCVGLQRLIDTCTSPTLL